MREPKREVKNLQISRYDHGGSRIYLEDADGNRKLLADTYQIEDREAVYEAIKATMSAPPEAREDEALRDANKVADYFRPLVSTPTFADASQAAERVVAALRSRQSAPAACADEAIDGIVADLVEYGLISDTEDDQDAFYLRKILGMHLLPDAARPSAQGEDDTWDLITWLEVTARASTLPFKVCKRLNDAAVEITELRARLASALEDVARSEQHARNKFADAMSFKARAEKAEAALASADASARELRDFVARVAEPGPRTGEDARDWQREANLLLALAALERSKEEGK